MRKSTFRLLMPAEAMMPGLASCTDKDDIPVVGR